MAETEETLLQNSDTQPILLAIADLSKRIDNLEKKSDNFETFVNAKFEAIRRCLVDNSAAYDRLPSSIHSTRFDVFGLRADVKELTEEVRQERKALK